MKKSILSLTSAMLFVFTTNAQKVEFEECYLDNGMFENNFVNSNSSLEGIANSLARYNVLSGDTNLVNSEIDIFRSITREEIQAVAKKYLNPNQRLILEYLPEEK